MSGRGERTGRRVSRSVVLPLVGDRAPGLAVERPGGQHANKTETRVEAVFDVAGSTALTETQKRRVVARSGPMLRAAAQDERSQSRNRELATDRLVARLAEALRVSAGGCRPAVASREGAAVGSEEAARDDQAAPPGRRR